MGGNGWLDNNNTVEAPTLVITGYENKKNGY